MNIKNIIGIIARIFVGLVFVASSLTKIISIEAVDLFVYEHQLFSWEISTFVTRLLILTELSLGILLILGVYIKQVRILSILMLIGFTLYIILKPILFNIDEENCHCFGTVILLNDTQTLIKNIVLLIISYFMFWNNLFDNATFKFIGKYQKIITIICVLVGLVIVNTVIMPEPLERQLFPKTASIDKDKFNLLIGLTPVDNISGKDTVLIPLYNYAQDSIQNLGVTQGKKILCLYSTGCKYCKRSAIRLDVVRQKYNIADSSFALIFWGSNAKIDSFFVQTNTQPLPHTLVHPSVFLPATKGKQPVIALINNGQVEKLLKYPNINEKEITQFIFGNKK